ncbi:hypothetical protein R3P38DRAFT_2559332 [Favolaschia claudopus]|uniref:Ig-like domain-containing protein n=1 Tax=Favolaschia claudopus TaxID=2862362 RepID=A0AAW0A555_9AGAR
MYLSTLSGGFLRRSRTSSSVLQTALCYLEAIRPKVPELILKEQSGQGSSAEFDSEFKALTCTAELELSAMEFDTPVAWRNAEDVMDTVRVCDNDDIACAATPLSISVLVSPLFLVYSGGAVASSHESVLGSETQLPKLVIFLCYTLLRYSLTFLPRYFVRRTSQMYF